MLLAASAIGILFRSIGFPEANIVLLYILSVLITSCITKGYLWGILSSIGATFAFNYFFTIPYLSFSVYDPSYIITFIIMTITAFIASTLTSRVKQNVLTAQEKEQEANALYELTSHLTGARDISDITSIAASAVSKNFGCCAACLCFNEKGIPEPVFIQQNLDDTQIQRETTNSNEILTKVSTLSDPYYVGSEFWEWPVHGSESILYMIRIPTKQAEILTDPQKHLLSSMNECTAMAMDRFRLIQQQIKSNEETLQERYRGDLLRAISHDLRTPLSGISGTSEMLMDMTDQTDARFSLAEDIYKEAEWLHKLVENILSLTKLQDGKLTIHKVPEAAEEIIGGAIAHISKRSPQYNITVLVPEEPLFVPMDAKLMEQVLINLLDNAIKHTPPENEINISVIKDTTLNRAIFIIRDHGKGIEAADMSIIFQAFYTSRAKLADAERGIGLGLTICDAIIKAHGGLIEAHNCMDEPGAEFTLTLPLNE